MRIKDLEYHKKELHKISEKIKQLKKDFNIAKRKKSEEILFKLLDNYKYSITRKDQKDIKKRNYVRNKINLFYKLTIAKVFHQSVIVMLLKYNKRRKKEK